MQSSWSYIKHGNNWRVIVLANYNKCVVLVLTNGRPYLLFKATTTTTTNIYVLKRPYQQQPFNGAVQIICNIKIPPPKQKKHKKFKRYLLFICESNPEQVCFQNGFKIFNRRRISNICRQPDQQSGGYNTKCTITI